MFNKFDSSILWALLLLYLAIKNLFNIIRGRKYQNEGATKRLGERIFNLERGAIYIILMLTLYEHPIYNITKIRDDEYAIRINTTGRKNLYKTGNLKITLYYLENKRTKLVIENTYNFKASFDKTANMIIGGVARNALIYNKICENSNKEDALELISSNCKGTSRIHINSNTDEVFNRMLLYNDRTQQLIDSDLKGHYAEYSINSVYWITVKINEVNDEITFVDIAVDCNSMSAREKINSYIVLYNVEKVVKYINDEYNSF